MPSSCSALRKWRSATSNFPASSAQLPALQRWVQLLFDYLVGELGGDPSVVAAALYADYRRVTGKLHVPEVLRGLVQPARPQKIAVRGELPLRQRRHVRES